VRLEEVMEAVLAETAVPLRRPPAVETDRVRPVEAEAWVPVADRPMKETEQVAQVGVAGAPVHHPLVDQEAAAPEPLLVIGPQVGGTISQVSWGSLS